MKGTGVPETSAEARVVPADISDSIRLLLSWLRGGPRRNAEISAVRSECQDEETGKDCR